MATRPEPSDLPVSLLASLLRHYEELVEYVRRRFVAPGLAREVVHDVCLRLLERPPPRDVRQPDALLRRIAHDAAVDRCRAEALRRHWVEPRQVLPDAACPVPGHEQRIEGEQELALLVSIIKAMPLRRRQVFILHKLHEIPQADVAVRMGIGPKAVEKHLRLAMAMCRQRIGRKHLP